MLAHFLSSLFVLLAFVDLSGIIHSRHVIYTMEAPKWIALYALSLLLIALVYWKEKKVTLKVPSFFRWILVLYLASLGLTLLSAPLGYMEKSISEKFLMCALALSANIAMQKEGVFLEKLKFWIFGSSPILYACLFWGQLNGTPYKFFGNPHPLSELLAVLALIQAFFIFYPTRLKDKASQRAIIYQIIIFATGIAFILFLRSRTAMLGCLIGLSSYMMLNLFSKVKVTKRSTYGIRGVIALLAVAFVFYSSTTGKITSVNYRIVKWKNTLQMIQDKPLGVGLGNFFSAYTGYQNSAVYDVEATEGWVLENPHNAFLEHAAEEGILSALVILVALSFMLIQLFKLPQTGITPLLKALFAFLLVDAFFNYPQDNSYPFFIISFCLGAIAFKISDTSFVIKPKTWALFAALCSLFLIYFPVRYYTALYLSSSRIASQSQKACAVDDQVWVACVDAMSDDWKNKKFEDALSKFSRLESRFVGHFVLRKKRIEYLWTSGKKTEACDAAIEYNALFNGKSTLVDFHKSMCTDLR